MTVPSSAACYFAHLQVLLQPPKERNVWMQPLVVLALLRGA